MPRSALRAAIISVVVGLVVGLAGIPAASARGPACERQSEHNSGIRLTSPLERPVVMVHGWNSSSGALTGIEQALTAPGAETAGRVRPLYFDYRSATTHWASVPEIAACLAEYVRAASDEYRRVTAGADGRVVVVAHSMGGLAIRFATDPRYARIPISADQLGGVVTLGTPSLGSPFGGLGPESDLNRLISMLNSTDRLGLFESREQGTDGGTCLASHGPDHALPDGCAVAPFLPAPWRLTEVAGDVSIDRSVFGIHLYDIPLASDGVVPRSSANGYPVSATGEAPQPAHIQGLRVTCRVGFDAVYSAAVAALAGGGRPGGGGAKANLAWLAVQPGIEVLKDFRTFEDLANEEMGFELATFLGYASFMASCGHLSLTRDPAALALMVGATAGSLDVLESTGAPPRPTISLAGYSGFRWGDSVDAAEEALGRQFVVNPYGAGDCSDADLPGGPMFAIRAGAVTNADVHDDSVVTDTGISVGDPLSEVLSAYPGISGSPVPVWPGSTDYQYTSGGRSASFVTYDGATVDYMRFGLAGTFGEASPCE